MTLVQSLTVSCNLDGPKLNPGNCKFEKKQYEMEGVGREDGREKGRMGREGERKDGKGGMDGWKTGNNEGKVRKERKEWKWKEEDSRGG